MKVKDLHPRQVVTILAHESLRSVTRHLIDDGVGALVVMGSREAKGIISERDITRAVADGVNLDSTPVCDYMTATPVVVNIEDSVDEAMEKMNDFEIRHLLVVEGEREDITGVLSIRDLVVPGALRAAMRAAGS